MRKVKSCACTTGTCGQYKLCCPRAMPMANQHEALQLRFVQHHTAYFSILVSTFIEKSINKYIIQITEVLFMCMFSFTQHAMFKLRLPRYFFGARSRTHRVGWTTQQTLRTSSWVASPCYRRRPSCRWSSPRCTHTGGRRRRATATAVGARCGPGTQPPPSRDVPPTSAARASSRRRPSAAGRRAPPRAARAYTATASRRPRR